MVDLATRRFLARYRGDGFNMRSNEKVGCLHPFSSINMRVMIVTLEPLDGRLWLVTWLKVVDYGKYR
jgi:hypothetical protein